MANSVVKVTEPLVPDSFILVIGEDGTVTPNKETAEAYLSSRSCETDLHVMQIKQTDCKSVDVTLDKLTYLPSYNEDGYSSTTEMDQVSRNLLNFRMDHDYTPLTSPRRHDSLEQIEEVDELAQTLSYLEGSSEETPVVTHKIVKIAPKTIKKQTLSPKVVIKTKSPLSVLTKQASGTAIKVKSVKHKEAEEDLSDKDFTLQSDASEDDKNDSDFEIEKAVARSKVVKKIVPTRKSSETHGVLPKITNVDINKVVSKPPVVSPKVEEVHDSNKSCEKKLQAKKEKKTPKPIPDDFALFSTPDIIRRVGGKQEGSTLTTPELQKSLKPAKIFSTIPTKINARKSVDSKEKRVSVDDKVTFQKEARHSLDSKIGKAQSVSLNDVLQKKTFSNKLGDSMEDQSSLDEYESESNSTKHLQLPSAEDIRAIIQNENTKTFTNSLIIPEPIGEQIADDVVQSNINLEGASLDLDQSILDNINTDLLSEDILLQVAQSLAGNTELQNAIEKSLVDGNIVLDTSTQSLTDEDIESQQFSISLKQASAASSPTGTQVVRPDGRVVVIPPIERPTTRSRNKKTDSEVVAVSKVIPKVLDDEHVSGAELDSSSDEEKSDDDPDKLWCICNQPHNNRFMICCDNCEEWYHGKCVNVTKAMGKMMEQEGKEWICVYCKDNSLKRPAAAARRVRKASRTSTEISGDDKRSSENSSTVSLASSVSGCLVCGKPCRSNSIYCSDPCILQHAKGFEKVVVYDRKTGNFLSGNNAPIAANLDKWLQENPNYEVVRPQKPKAKPAVTQSKLKIVKNPLSQGGVSLAVQRKGVNVGILQHSPKQSSPQQKQQPITGVKIVNNKSITTGTPRVKLIQPAPAAVRTAIATPSKPKVTQSTLKPVVLQVKDKPMPQKTPKSRQVEDTAPPSNKQENIRDNVKKTLLEQLTNRVKMADDLKLSKEEITKISNEIESQLYKCFGDTGQKYRNKYRSLMFNIKDNKNQTLWRRICEKSVNPYQLVRLSSDDLASQELALWRERENKHQLDMITKSELEQLGRNRQYVFKTHKGEQELEENRPSDAVKDTEVVMGLAADNSSESSSDQKKESKEKDKKSCKQSKADRDKRERDRKKKREHRSLSGDKSRRRSRSKESTRHSDRVRSRSRDRHRKSSHKSSRHKKDDNASAKLDKKSKEILEQLVDNKIVPPLEDRLWKHVQQEDITTAPMAESDSDHEPTSTVTIPTPPRIGEIEESQALQSEVTKKHTEVKEDFESNAKDENEDDVSKSPPPRMNVEALWKGTINMVDVAQISITAHEVSGDCSGLGKELPTSLDVVGRISPDTVWEYIGKMRSSNSKAISLVRLKATNMEEKMPYIALYSYLSSRNRLGVIKTINKAVKDFYILPLSNQKPIPQALLPINGPGFEESRPAILLGIIVRDKRKRPLFPSATPSSKRPKVDVASVVTPRSYTPPPSVDSKPKRLHLDTPKADLEEGQEEEEEEEEDDIDGDEPYTPEDSDPDTTPNILDKSEKISAHLNSTEISNLLTGTVKSSSFLETGLNTETFEPFKTKFDTIPGLEEGNAAALPANTQEIQRKMEELDQRIAMQKAEIQNMSQDIVASSTTSDIGTTALASIALPSNLQQILDSIKSINSVSETDSIASTSDTQIKTDSDLTIPLILPKIGARSNSTVSPTIPLNLPKLKSFKPERQVEDKSTSVLSSLSEEDLIRKAAEMLGETDTTGEEPSYVHQQQKSGRSVAKNMQDSAQPPIPGIED